MCSFGTGFLWYEYGNRESDLGEHQVDETEAAEGKLPDG